MNAAPEIKVLSEDEYFVIDEASPIKHEFWNGYIFAMAGAASRANCQSPVEFVDKPTGAFAAC